MADYQDIYDHHADAYDELVSREDYENHLIEAIGSVASLRGADVVETGAGTGRVSLLLSPLVGSVRAFDRSASMLASAQKKIAARGISNVTFAVASHGHLPVAQQSADLAIEGWAFGHAVAWNPSAWVAEVDANVAELARVVRPGGSIVLIETMGTGVDAPFEGGHSLEPLHRHLIDELGFSHQCVRTDYRFDGVEDAAARIGFFFGENMAAKVRARGWVIVPEHTGVYSRG